MSNETRVQYNIIHNYDKSLGYQYFYEIFISQIDPYDFPQGRVNHKTPPPR